MNDIAKFKPKTVYVIYIAATPEKVWQALMAFIEQQLRANTADITGATDDENVHRPKNRRTPPLINPKCGWPAVWPTPDENSWSWRTIAPSST